MKSLPPFDPDKNVCLAPHVVILGAGASDAAFPKGNKYGVHVPLMNNLVEVVGLKELLQSRVSNLKERNFEDIYDELSSQSGTSNILEAIENKIYLYFSSLELPDEITLYDKLLLSLRSKDAIATFNWDPFLALSYRRNRHLKELPEIIHLHGNVSIGICSKDKVKGFIENKCSKCRKKLERVKLLYPIKKKDYSKDDLISAEWNLLEHFLQRAYIVTIFGYSAPQYDVDAIDMMKKFWEVNKWKELAEIEIIDIKPREELYRTWEPMIVRQHYRTWTKFAESFLNMHPRRTCEAFASATLQNDPWECSPIPEGLTLEEFQNWIEPMVKEEVRYYSDGNELSRSSQTISMQ